MKGLSLIQPVDPAQLDKETQRIYEICDGCRRCFNLCPSFNTLLNGIDRHEGDVAKLTSEDHRRIVDECYYCKLCFNHCPYTPPHQYEIDFPHLMILWKQRLAAERGVRWRDRWLTGTDFIGKIGTLTAGPLNWLMTRSTVRRLVEAHCRPTSRPAHSAILGRDVSPMVFQASEAAAHGGSAQESRLVFKLPRELPGYGRGQGRRPSFGKERGRGRHPRAALLRHALL